MKKYLLLFAAIGFFGMQSIFAQHFFLDNGPKGSAVDWTMTSYTETGSKTITLQTELDKGKVVLYDYFFTTCGYCQVSAPELEKIYKDLGPTGNKTIEIVSLDVNNTTHGSKSIADYKTQFGVSNPMFDIKAYGSYSTWFYSTPYRNPSGPTSYGLPHFIAVCADGSWTSLHQDDVFPGSAAEVNKALRDLIKTCGVSTVGIADFKDDARVSIAPNPASDVLTVNYQSSDLVTVEIIDAMGKLKYSAQMNSSIQIDISQFEKGVYFLSIVDKSQKITQRVMVQ